MRRSPSGSPGRAGWAADPLPLPKGAGTTVDWTYGVANGFLVDKGVLDANGPTLLDARDGVALSWMVTKTADPFNPLDPSMLMRPPANLTVLEGNGCSGSRETTPMCW